MSSTRKTKRALQPSQDTKMAQEIMGHYIISWSPAGLFAKSDDALWADAGRNDYVKAKKINDDLEDERCRLEESLKRISLKDKEILKITRRLRKVYKLKDEAHKEMSDAWALVRRLRA